LSSPGPELSVVLPVFREAEIIASVLDAWCGMLDRERIDYELLAYDDGSPDATLAILQERASARPRIVVASHANRGHGPTIVRGYREARGDWVFQVDSDEEMSPDSFPLLWSRRADHDFLIARREGGPQPLPRRIVSAVSRLTVRCLFGRGVTDVNAPYRLMRRSWLESALEHVPERAFAPNVILSGVASRDRLRILESPVPRRGRTTGQVSLVSWALWRRALESFAQTLRSAWSVRRRS
jgi:glycosyltransferase involved in cell wall biosynthesis